MQLKVHWFISLIKSNSLKHFTLIYNDQKILVFIWHRWHWVIQLALIIIPKIPSCFIRLNIFESFVAKTHHQSTTTQKVEIDISTEPLPSLWRHNAKFTTFCKLSLLPAFKAAKIPSSLFTAHTGNTEKGENLIHYVTSRVTEVLPSHLLFK